MVRLADILPPTARVSLLKVDTEGFEAEIFKGVDAELLARVEHVVVEVKTEGGRAHLRALLGRAGFGCRQYREQYTERPGVLRGGSALIAGPPVSIVTAVGPASATAPMA